MAQPGIFQSFTLPATSGGLNRIDAIDSLPPQDAIDLINIFPEGSKCCVRGGIQYLSDTASYEASPVFTLASMAFDDTSFSLIKAANGEIIEVSTPAPAVETVLDTGYGSNDWVTCAFNNFLFMANGVDAPIYINDAGTVTTTTYTTLSGNPFVLDPTTLVHVWSYKGRLYYIQENSCLVWSTPALGAITGDMASSDFSTIFKKGGYAMFGGTWTNQNGTTTNDLWYVMSSEGEIVFYAGDSFAISAPTVPWVQVARYETARPLGRKAYLAVDSDVWLLTERGIISISELFNGGVSGAYEGIGRKINPIIATYVASTPLSYRWQGIYFASGQMAIVVVPYSETATFLLVCNVLTGAWAMFQYPDNSIPMSPVVHDGLLYLGSTSGLVYQAETGQSDIDQPIQFLVRWAPNFFGSRGNYKVFRDARPLLYTGPSVGLALSIETDFQQNSTLDAVTTTIGEETPWGSPWGSPWSSGPSYRLERYTIPGQGFAGSLKMSGAVSGFPFEINAVDIRYEGGGQI